MRTFLTGCILIGVVFFAKNNALGQIMFEKTFGDELDYGYAVRQTADNGYILYGHTTSRPDFRYSWKLMKTDSLGEVQWQKTYEYEYVLESADAVQQTSDGGYIICGSLGGPFNDSLVLMKVDDQGSLMWKNSYSVAPGTSIGKSVEQTLDGGFIVTGYGGVISREDIYVIKTDFNGLLEWSKTYGGINLDRGYGIRQAVDGTYLVVGETLNFGNGGYDVFVLKLNSVGDTLWTKAYGTSLHEGGYAIDLTSDSGFILTGVSGSNQNRNIYVVRGDEFGNIEWEKEYGGDGYDFGNSVVQTNDGGFFIAGKRTLTDELSEMYCIRTNSFGDIMWEKGFRKGEVNEAFSARQTRDGGFIILGTTAYVDSVTTTFMYLVKTTAEGNITSIESPMNIPYQACPNPFFENTVIKFENPVDEDYRLCLFDPLGKKILETRGLSRNEISLDVMDLPAAHYYFKIVSENQEIGHGRLIKQ